MNSVGEVQKGFFAEFDQPRTMGADAMLVQGGIFMSENILVLRGPTVGEQVIVK